MSHIPRDIVLPNQLFCQPDEREVALHLLGV